MKRRIERKASDLLKKYGYYDSIPIDVFGLAQDVGLKLVDHKLSDEISGMLIWDNGVGSIGYNSTHAQVRQRFTIAHEIGHFVLGHIEDRSVFIDQPNKQMSTKIFRNQDSAKGEKREEIEANSFAAALLMPKVHIKDRCNNYAIDDIAGNDIELLAKDFQVSTQSMIFRLINLGIIRA